MNYSTYHEQSKNDMAFEMYDTWYDRLTSVQNFSVNDAISSDYLAWQACIPSYHHAHVEVVAADHYEQFKVINPKFYK